MSDFASKKYPVSLWDTLDVSIKGQTRAPSSSEVSLYPSEASVTAVDGYGQRIVIGACNRRSWLRNKLQRQERGQDFQSQAIDDILVDDFSPQSLWKFEISRKTEDMIVEQAQLAGIYSDLSKTKFEFFLDPEIGVKSGVVRGELDLVIKQTPDSDKLVGAEIKSVSGYYTQKQVFGTVSKKGGYLQKPEPKGDNLLQTVLYAYVFGVVRKQIEYFKLVYFSRESGERSEFEIDLVPELVDGKTRHRVYVDHQPYKYQIYAEDILERYAKLQAQVLMDEVPDRDFDLQYDDGYIDYLYSKSLLGKTDEGFYLRNKKAKKSPLLKKGDPECGYCKFKSTCYSSSGEPIDYIKDTLAATLFSEIQESNGDNELEEDAASEEPFTLF